MLNRLLGLFSNDIGIDLGTANTLVYVKDHGIVLREPSVVAVKAGTNEVLAVGDEAKRMLGRTPGNIVAIRPLKDGVIADFEVTEAMLRHFIRKVHNRRTLCRVRASSSRCPRGITEVEKRAVKECADPGRRRAKCISIEEPMAAAIGVGLPVQEAAGQHDRGHRRRHHGSGDHLAVRHRLQPQRARGGRRTRRGHHPLHEARLQSDDRRAHRGGYQDRASAPPILWARKRPWRSRAATWWRACRRPLTHHSQEVREAMLEPIYTIIDAVRITLERCPPELSADLVDRGMVLAGGGALLRGLDKLLHEETGLPVHVAEDPLSAVAEGAGVVLSEIDFLRKVARADRVY